MFKGWRHKRKLKKFAGTIVTTFGSKAESERVLADEHAIRQGRELRSVLADFPITEESLEALRKP
jgi:hypothetical protein